MRIERAMRLMVAATLLVTLGIVAARPGVRARVAWVAPSMVQSTPEASGTPPESVVLHPTDANRAIIRVENVGGLAPPVFLLLEVPQFVLYGDGLIVYSGPLARIDPRPALPNLRQMRVDQEGIQVILAEAAAAGLTGEDRAFSNELVMDASTTVFTVDTGDRVTTSSVYALGLSLGPNAPPEEVAGIEAIVAFTTSLANLPTWLPAGSIVEPERPYLIERLQVVSQPAADAGLQSPEAATWPLATPLGEFGMPFSGVPSLFQSMFSFENARCGVVGGDDTALLVASLHAANSDAAWQSDGDLYALYPRPLLPDEVGCPPRPANLATPAA